MLNKEKALHLYSVLAKSELVFKPPLGGWRVTGERIVRFARDPQGVLNKEKAGHFVPGFFFVAECDEISNLYLIRDIVRIIRLQEFLQLRK
jgi:hypothetical protein